jgi:hypothetical protein
MLQIIGGEGGSPSENGLKHDDRLVSNPDLTLENASF